MINKMPHTQALIRTQIHDARRAVTTDQMNCVAQREDWSPKWFVKKSPADEW